MNEPDFPYDENHGVDFDAPRDFYDEFYSSAYGWERVSTFPGEQPSTIPGQLTLDDACES